MDYHSDYAETAPERLRNPWLSMWTEPKLTIRQIVTTNPQQYILLLVTVYGIYQVIERDDFIVLLESIGGLGAWTIALIGGFVWGILTLYIYSALLQWTGGWLNGRANGTEIRAAFAWSTLPYILMVIVLLIDIFMVQPVAPNSWTSVTLLSINFAFIIWSVVLLCRGLAEVQGFSSWTGLGNTLLATLMMLLCILGFFIVILVFIVILRSAS